MSSSSSAPVGTTRNWSPGLDLTTAGLSVFDPDRVVEAIADGRETGYRAGYAAGQAEAAAHAELLAAQTRAEATQLLEAIANAAQRLAAEDSRARELFAEHVIDLALELSAAILGRELRDPHDAAAEAVRRALEPLDIGAAATVRVHPTDLERLGDTERPAGVTLVADPEITPGDAIAVTPSQTIDARIDAALDRARSALAGTP